MIINLIQLKKGSHKVISLLDRLIFKYYTDYQSLERDIAGIKSWQKYDDKLVPKVYFRCGKFAVYEFIKAKNGTDFLTRDIIKVFKYFFGENTGEKHIRSWTEYIKGISSFYKNSQILSSYLDETHLSITTASLGWLLNIDWKLHKLFPLHRDLCWTNALTGFNQNFKVIDFEHFLIGPIEYEFANSMFWNDEMSLNMRKVVQLGAEEGLQINLTLLNRLVVLYFVDQVRSAFEKNDGDKVRLLVSKYAEFIRHNSYLESISKGFGFSHFGYDFLY